MGLRRFTKTRAYNIKGLRRLVAARILEKNAYPF
jgi:hypothetical protein